MGMEERLLATPSNEWPLDWSMDGRFLLYYQDGGKTGADLWALSITGDDRAPIAVAKTPFEETTGEFSPDGRWVAYETLRLAGPGLRAQDLIRGLSRSTRPRT